MNCEQFQKEIERAIDERSSSVSVSAILTGHADLCEKCHSAWQDFLLLESALASWTEPAEVDLIDRVVEAAASEASAAVPEPSKIPPSVPSLPKGEGTTRHWLAIATAAILVIGTAIVFRPAPDQTVNNDSPNPAPEHDVPFTPGLNEDDQYAGVDELIASTRSAWEGIASKAASQASGLSIFVPDLKTDLGLPESEEPEPEEPPEVEVNGQEPSLIPGEINRAFDFLLDVSDVTAT